MHGSAQIAVPYESPLVVEVRDLLPRNDVAIEAVLVMARRQPATLLRLLPGLLSRNRPQDEMLDEASNLDVTTLPYDEDFIQMLRDERSNGRQIILVAGSFPDTARRMARHLDVFDGMSTDGADASNARASLVEHAPATSWLRAWSRALRVHQWLKNLLLLVPLIAAHKYIDPALLSGAVLAVLCFSLMASAAYLMNDLLDIADDRHHPTKRHRPLAAGQVSIMAGFAAIPLLVAGSLALAVWLLPPRFSLCLAAYLILTLTYSLTLKRRMVVDVVSLAALYTLRIVAGAIAIAVPLSFWLLAFSMFLFMSLALIKRYAELFQVRATGWKERARGRGYWARDLEMIASLGTAAGYMAVMVLALYVNDPVTAGLYRHPHYIWFACPLLLMWISRVWMLAHRGHMNEDPLVFAVYDRVSLLLGALLAGVFWLAR